MIVFIDAIVDGAILEKRWKCCEKFLQWDGNYKSESFRNIRLPLARNPRNMTWMPSAHISLFEWRYESNKDGVWWIMTIYFTYFIVRGILHTKPPTPGFLAVIAWIPWTFAWSRLSRRWWHGYWETSWAHISSLRLRAMKVIVIVVK